MINKSGLAVIEYKILVKLDEVKRVTKGGIELPEIVRDNEQMKQVKATLIAKGGTAFEGFKKPVPNIGDRIIVAKAVGFSITGMDDVEYKLMNDRDVAAIIMDEKKE